MKKSMIAAVCGILLLSGCASGNNYKMYAETQRAIADAEARKETARYNALMEIARQGDTASKVAAVMSIQFNNAGNANSKQQIAPPTDPGETALRWAGVLVPGLAQFYTINQNSKVAITQSNNSTQLGMKQSDNQTAVAVNTNSAFTNMNAAGLTTANSIATTGLSTANSIATTGMTSIVNVANTGSNNLTSTVNNLIGIIPNLQPNITTSTSTNTSSTNHNCGSNTSGSTLTCP
jgi:hypothetical protein